MAEADNMHIPDHRWFFVCWHHRGVPFWSRWRWIRIVSLRFNPQDAQNPPGLFTPSLGFAPWGRMEQRLTTWYVHHTSLSVARRLLTITKIDFRETAPGASDLWMYKNATDPNASTVGGLGLFISLLHSRYSVADVWFSRCRSGRVAWLGVPA